MIYKIIISETYKYKYIGTTILDKLNGNSSFSFILKLGVTGWVSVFSAYVLSSTVDLCKEQIESLL